MWIVEYFCDKGKNVLLLMDLLICYVQVQCEIVLVIGELLVIKGYLLLVFVKLLKLVECVGNVEVGGGLIIVFYIVFFEGDDQQDLIVDVVCGVFDGYFVLFWWLVEEGYYLVIDIEVLISWVMLQVVEVEYLCDVQCFKQFWLCYQQSCDLISVGVYVVGGDFEIDLVIVCFLVMCQFLCQGFDESESLVESCVWLVSLFVGGQV